MQEFLKCVVDGDYHSVVKYFDDGLVDVSVFEDDELPVLEMAQKSESFAVYQLLLSEGFNYLEDVFHNGKKYPKKQGLVELMDDQREEASAIPDDMYRTKQLIETVAIADDQSYRKNRYDIFESPKMNSMLLQFPTLEDYEQMSKEQLWLTCLNQMNAMYHDIIEFPKRLPRFSRLSHADQIFIIKRNAFELLVIRLSRLIDVSGDHLLFVQAMVPKQLIYSSNSPEMKFVAEVYETAKSIAQLEMKTSTIALFQALITYWPDVNFEIYNVDDPGRIIKRYNRILTALKLQLQGNEAALKALLEMVSTLRKLAKKNLAIFKKFQSEYPEMVFPVLVKEIYFNMDLLTL